MSKALLAFALLALSAGALAQEPAGAPPTAGQQLMYQLGSAGLLTRFSMYESFGTVQARIGQSRAQIERSRLPGAPTTGYEDSADVGVLPFDVIYELPRSRGHSFLKVGGVANARRGGANLTQLNIDTLRFEFQYLQAPTTRLLWGIGVIRETTDIDLRHNGGTIRSAGKGLRVDYLQKLGSAWGVAARAEYLWSEDETRVPLGGGLRYSVDQDSGRFYSQAELVGAFTRETLSWVPAGWVFQPSLGVVAQRNRFSDTQDNFGRPVSGTVGRSDDYAVASVGARFERMEFRPRRLAPYLGFGLEQEVANDLNALLDDPTIVRVTAGFSVNLGRGARLDFEYGRHDGLKGLRRDQALTVHFGLQF